MAARLDTGGGSWTILDPWTDWIGFGDVRQLDLLRSSFWAWLGMDKTGSIPVDAPEMRENQSRGGTG